MGELTGRDKDTLTEELRGVIFQNPLTDVWETACLLYTSRCV